MRGDDLGDQVGLDVVDDEAGRGQELGQIVLEVVAVERLVEVGGEVAEHRAVTWTHGGDGSILGR